MSRLDPDDWSGYWAKARVTTFSWQFDNNYDGEFLDFWRSQLSGNYTQIIDLACGNGALVWIANELVNQPQPRAQITGVDIADIEPFSTLGKNPVDYPQVRFIGNTGIDRLPFADGSIDLAISQYGIEYSDLDKTIPELGRVLSANGKMAFVLHDKQSDILRECAPQIGLINYVLDELQLEALFLKLDTLYNSAKSVKDMQTRPDIVACRGEINLVLAEIGQRVEDIKKIDGVALGSPLMANYVQHLKNEFPQGAPKKNGKRSKAIVEHTRALKVGLSRIEDLWAAALSEQQLQALVELIKAEGFELLELGKIGYRGSANWGTILVARRAR